MNSMNKVLKIIERYGDRLLRAHANAALITLDRDPWTRSTTPMQRQAELDSARLNSHEPQECSRIARSRGK